MKYDAHINVEVCATVKSIKYLFKYVYKGHDCANINLVRSAPDGVMSSTTLEWDEIKAHLDATYVSSPEAVWRLFEFSLHDISHSIIRLAIHLSNMQPIYFAEGNELDALNRAATKDTTLTAWFKLNRDNSDARVHLYDDIPNHFVFDRDNKWKRRQQGERVIGRMYSICSRDTERYHLRLLLLHTTGACSFEDLKKVDDEICQTFVNAAKRRGLLCDDSEHDRCLAETAMFQMLPQLRTLFCMILLHCSTRNTIDLWNSYKTNMVKDFMRNFDAETAEAMAFYETEAKLTEQGQRFADFGISPLPIFCPIQIETINKEEELPVGQQMYDALNENQRQAADEILEAYYRRSITTASCLFIDGLGGTGKTQLYHTLCRLFKGQGVHVLTVAWTRIAANLLPEGRTAHSHFKIPVPLLETSTSSIRPNTKEAAVIRKADVLIWNEAPMTPSYALKAVDILFRDIMNVNVSFGGKIMVLGGDFRQVSPVDRFANRSQLVAASLKSSELWSYFKIIRLNKNMRTGPGEEEFSEWLIKLGNGELPSKENDEIELPAACISDGNLADEVFGKHISLEDIPNLCDKVILCPKNEHALMVNEQVLQRLPGFETMYTSVDEVACEDGENVSNYPTEFLNSLTPSGMPPHKLNLKVGVIVMLLRNLDVNRGLCNGTRLIARCLHNHTIDCEVATGSNKGH
ncbi:unnamed protein product [Rotaria sp. Silwood2]|nr:unnamed protein product [Rotaria sp. Silwood2]